MSKAIIIVPTVVTFACYCTCGSHYAGTMPVNMIAGLQATFRERHHGPGHEIYPTRKAAKAATKKAKADK